MNRSSALANGHHLVSHYALRLTVVSITPRINGRIMQTHFGDSVAGRCPAPLKETGGDRPAAGLSSTPSSRIASPFRAVARSLTRPWAGDLRHAIERTRRSPNRTSRRHLGHHSTAAVGSLSSVWLRPGAEGPCLT